MQTENRLFDDLARVASGAINTLGGVREEIELRVKERLERLAGEMDLVTREEFDAVQAMAAKARAEQEALKARLDRLEAKLAALETADPAPEARARPKRRGAEVPTLDRGGCRRLTDPRPAQPCQSPTLLAGSGWMVRRAARRPSGMPARPVASRDRRRCGLPRSWSAPS
ncbi:MAG: accessory factor UbiK family protein [Geminicoccaceae bacterium]